MTDTTKNYRARTPKLEWTSIESLGASDYKAEYDGWRFRARKSYRGGLWLVDGWRDGHLAFSGRGLTFAAVRRMAEQEIDSVQELDGVEEEAQALSGRFCDGSRDAAEEILELARSISRFVQRRTRAFQTISDRLAVQVGEALDDPELTGFSEVTDALFLLLADRVAEQVKKVTEASVLSLGIRDEDTEQFSLSLIDLSEKIGQRYEGR